MVVGVVVIDVVILAVNIVVVYLLQMGQVWLLVASSMCRILWTARVRD